MYFVVPYRFKVSIDLFDVNLNHYLIKFKILRSMENYQIPCQKCVDQVVVVFGDSP